MALKTALLHISGLARWRARRGVAALWHNSAGTAILEFGLVGPMFIGLLIATLNTALIFLAQAGLQTTAESVARMLLTGQIQSYSASDLLKFPSLLTSGSMPSALSIADQINLKKAICGTLPNSSYTTNLAPVYLNCQNIVLSVSANPISVDSNGDNSITVPSFYFDVNGTLSGNFNIPVENSSSSNQVLVVQLGYMWPTPTGPFGLNFNNQPSGHLLTGTAVLSTEYYNCPTGLTKC